MNGLETKINSVNCVDVDTNNNKIIVTKEDNSDSKSFQFNFVYPKRNREWYMMI
jgi:hypothetical protein